MLLWTRKRGDPPCRLAGTSRVFLCVAALFHILFVTAALCVERAAAAYRRRTGRQHQAPTLQRCLPPSRPYLSFLETHFSYVAGASDVGRLPIERGNLNDDISAEGAGQLKKSYTSHGNDLFLPPLTACFPAPPKGSSFVLGGMRGHPSGISKRPVGWLHDRPHQKKKHHGLTTGNA